MNVRLGSEGAPVYVDQSPSYIYKNPPMQYNQNGVALPLPDRNAQVVPGQNTSIGAVFEQEGENYTRKLDDIGTKQNIYTNTISPLNRQKRQRGKQLSLPVPAGEKDDQFQREGENQYMDYERGKELMSKINLELQNAQINLTDILRVIDEKDIEVEKIIEDLYNDKLN